MRKSRALCVIPARGGSKRIPRKNVRDFCGKPIVAYSIEAALESKLFDEVMVSTDDEEIAEVARAHGASVPFMRSAKTSDDFATTADVLEEVLTEYKARGRSFDALCCLYATAPFVTPARIVEAFALLDTGVDSVISAVRFSFPPQRAFRVEDGQVAWWMPKHALTRSQDLEPLYHDAGQLYLARTEAFRREHALVCGVSRLLVLPDAEVQDIDTLQDWKIAEDKFRNLKGLNE